MHAMLTQSSNYVSLTMTVYDATTVPGVELRLVVLNSSSTDDTMGLLPLARVCVNALPVRMSSWVGKSVNCDSYVQPCADLNSNNYTTITTVGKQSK